MSKYDGSNWDITKAIGKIVQYKTSPTPNFIIETAGFHNGYPYFTVANQFGYRCGYVGVGREHSLYHVGAENKNFPRFDVHGGITYNSESPLGGVYFRDLFNSDERMNILALWWFGFDCGHYGDAKDESILVALGINDVEALYEARSSIYEGNIKYREQVEEECQNLIDQLIDFEQISWIKGDKSENDD